MEMRHRGAKAQRHRVTEAQRHRGTKAQRDKGTEAQRHKGTEGQRHKGTEGQRDKGTSCLACLLLNFLICVFIFLCALTPLCLLKVSSVHCSVSKVKRYSPG